MMRIRKKYAQVALAAFSNQMEYRADFLLGLLSKVFPIIIQLFMWNAIYRNSGKQVGHYSYEQIVMYTVIAPLIYALVAVSIQYEIASEIKDGKYSRYIILPAGHFTIKLLQFIGARAAEFVFIAGIFVVCCFLFQRWGCFAPGPVNILVFVPVLVLAMFIQFLIAYVFSALAFWMGECHGVFFVLSVFTHIISGGLFPLDIFGQGVLVISRILPFYYITYFPVNIIIGKPIGPEIAMNFAIMLAWIMALGYISRVVWRRGEKKYIAAGG